MSREDYEKVLIALGSLSGQILSGRLLGDPDEMLAMLNRVNSGNPNYTPYQVEEKKS